ncbi:MAG: Uma2 family endonuclease [Thermoguttaceae bacterium]
MSTIAHLTLAQYDRMIAAGVFDQGQRRRLEFIHGEIREMNPIGSRHEEIVDWLTVWSVDNLPRKEVRVRIQNSIGLPALESAPEPDVAWVVQRSYSRGRPVAEDVLLVIEVAESSLAVDTGEKADLYAAAGIADYWVVDVAAERIEVRREPLSGRYQSITTYSGNDDLRPLRLPEISLRPASLWSAR